MNSCKPKESVPEELRLERTNRISFLNQFRDSPIIYTYDEGGKLNSVVAIDPLNNEQTSAQYAIRRDSLGRIIQVQKDMASLYIASDSNIFRNDVKYTFQYIGEKPSQIRCERKQRGGIWKVDATVTIQYDSLGRLTEFSTMNPNYFRRYVYSRRNNVVETYCRADNFPDRIIMARQNINYDQYKVPWLIHPDILFMHTFVFLDEPSQNNPTAVLVLAREVPASGGVYASGMSSTYTYTYQANDFPVNVVQYLGFDQAKRDLKAVYHYTTFP